MVNAVAATSYEGPSAVSVIEVESRPPQAGQVVVAVRAAALNPFDAKMTSGAAGTDPAKLPLRLGSEAAGVVTAVGEDAVGLGGEPLAVGDEVYGHRLSGAQASELTVNAENLIRKPPEASFGEAAGLLSAGTTAVHGLESVRVTSGDVVLIHGASGGVGRLAAQLAMLRGARVIGTASPKRHAGLAALGIEPVAYGEGLVERVAALAPGGIDAAFDTIGTDEALETSLQLLSDSSRFVTIVNFAAALAAGGQAIGGGPGADPGREIRAAARLTLAGFFADGMIDVQIARSYPLAEARAAYEYLVTGHAGGKVILEP
ncbi:NADP-dependent oxidoreductase [Pseudolysinimonas sp.]|uniref:NADP-dependent oxidoreductase n=1 Tax=Pseudolysinimonas sp. TaxID=2680009 RepID=UPI00286A7056|nr:NADP-dependent oxidoreductase [Pseudolysinimonas sp.]